VATLKEYELEVMECLRCKTCTSLHPPELYQTEHQLICPSLERFKFFAYGAGGQMSIAKAIVLGNLDWSREVAEVVYKCTMCGACREKCLGNFGRIQNPDSFKWTNLIECFQLMRAQLIEHGHIPGKVKDFLQHIMNYGNPWAEAADARGEWIEGTGIRKYNPGDEYLFYVGDLGSYDPRGRRVAETLGKLFMKCGVSVGVLGNDEGDDGNEVSFLGEEGLFEHLARQNIESWQRLRVKKIVTLSPHAYNAVKNDYPKFGGEFEVSHYTQILADLIRKGKIKFKPANLKVTFHDPCFLGRHNGIYETPRQVLGAIKGLNLIEMARTRESSFCCGGGSGNYYMDLLGGGPNSPARVRIREARDSGAAILATACPACLTMLEDAPKTEGIEEKVTVKDLSEIVAECSQ